VRVRGLFFWTPPISLISKSKINRQEPKVRQLTILPLDLTCLFPRESRRPLLHKGPRAFLHVCGGAAKSKQRRFQELPLFPSHLQAAIHSLKGKLKGKRRIRCDLAGQGGGGGSKLRGRRYLVD
jgi:hypothetical protein